MFSRFKVTDFKTPGTCGFNGSILSAVDFEHSKAGTFQFITEKGRIFGHIDDVCIIHFLNIPLKSTCCKSKSVRKRSKHKQIA